MPDVQIDRDEAACVITLNRPDKRNAVSVEMMQAIAAAAQAAAQDDAGAAVIVTGGPTFFSAGADLNEALAGKRSPQAIAYFGQWHRLTAAPQGLPQPVH